MERQKNEFTPFFPVVTKEGSIFSIVATVPVFAYVTLSDLRCKKMAINKKIREAVYQKYGGRCAYCGRAIACILKTGNADFLQILAFPFFVCILT